MADKGTDRNLLLGILALQMNFISQDQLIQAMNAWLLSKNQSLGEVLMLQEALSVERYNKITTLVEERIREGKNDDLTEPWSEEPGQVIQIRYRPFQFHKKGGLGEIFLAHDDELHRDVAIKQLQAKHSDSEDHRNRFLLEGEITGRLEHPGIVPVYGLGCFPDGKPFYAMRFIRGKSMREAIEEFHEANQKRNSGQRAIAFRDLVARFLDVCNAIAYAHSRGVLHLDLKPSNLMLGPYGETLVIDWGLAKVVKEATAVNQDEGLLRPISVKSGITGRAGTAGYMAPEQNAGLSDQICLQTDIYLLGGVLYEILTGSPPHSPYRRPDPPQAKVVSSWAPPAIDAILAKAMSPISAERYASALDLATDLRHWLAEEPLSAYRTAVEQFQKLVYNRPNVADYREYLARNRTNLALVLNGMGRHDEACMELESAIADYERLLGERHLARYRAELAACWVHLSWALRATNRTQEADRAQQRAVSEYDRLMESHPLDYRTNPASVMLTLAPGAENVEVPAEDEPGTIPPVSTSAAPPDTAFTDTVGTPGPTPDDWSEVRAKFTLLRQLAKGGMSTIWLALDNDLNREVVIKELAWGGTETEAIRRRLMREVQLTAQLEHPNIVTALGLGYRGSDRIPLLILRYVRGRTLADAIRKHHHNGEGDLTDLRLLLSLFVQACRGIAYAHSRGVIHRDPKPSNIFIGESGEVVVGDWGLAKSVSEADEEIKGVMFTGLADAETTQVGAIMGTPAYMPPEMAQGLAHITYPADVYILGASLYHLLTGHTPYSGTSHISVLEQLVSGKPPVQPRELVSSIPKVLNAVCMKALSHNPEDRYARVAEMAEEIESWLLPQRGNRLWPFGLWRR